MSIVLSVAPTAIRSWLFSWTGGVAPFAVWLDGDLLATTSSSSYEFVGANYEDAPPDIEVVDSLGASQNDAFPCRAVLQWRGLVAASGYMVEQLLAAVWTQVGFVAEGGEGYYTWRSEALADASAQQYRVSATDVDGGKGASLPFAFAVVRNPAHPDVTIAAGSSGAVLVS